MNEGILAEDTDAYDDRNSSATAQQMPRSVDLQTAGTPDPFKPQTCACGETTTGGGQNLQFRENSAAKP